jgi:hypothetical protein
MWDACIDSCVILFNLAETAYRGGGGGWEFKFLISDNSFEGGGVDREEE